MNTVIPSKAGGASVASTPHTGAPPLGDRAPGGCEGAEGYQGAKERRYRNHTLPSLKQAPLAHGTHDTEDSLSSLCLTEHSDLRDKVERQQVPACTAGMCAL